MEVKFKYIFLILLILESTLTFSGQYSVDSTYIWYMETTIPDQYFHRIQMLSMDQGFCISHSKEETFSATIHEYKNNQWHVIRSFPSSVLSNLLLFKQKGEIYLWTIGSNEDTKQHSIHYYNGRNWTEQVIKDFYADEQSLVSDLFLYGYNPQNILSLSISWQIFLQVHWP